MKKRWVAILMVMLLAVLTASAFALAEDSKAGDDQTTQTEQTDKNGEEAGGAQLNEAHTVSYSISGDGTGGTVSGAGQYEEGTTVTLTITPDELHSVQIVTLTEGVTPSYVTQGNDRIYTFTMPAKDVEANVTFQTCYFETASGIRYPNLQSAISDSDDGSTVKLIQSEYHVVVTQTSVDLGSKNITLDLNNNTFKYNEKDQGHNVTVTKGTLTIKNGIVRDGAADGDSGKTSFIASTNGTIIFDGGTFIGKFEEAEGTNGEIQIHSGYFHDNHGPYNVAYVNTTNYDIVYDLTDETKTSPNIELSGFNKDVKFYRVSDLSKHVAKNTRTNKTYLTLAEGVANAQSGDTVELYKNHTMTETLQINKALAIKIDSGITLGTSASVGYHFNGIEISKSGISASNQEVSIIGESNSKFIIIGDAALTISGILVHENIDFSINGIEIDCTGFNTCLGAFDVLNVDGSSSLKVSNTTINAVVPAGDPSETNCTFTAINSYGAADISNTNINIDSNDDASSVIGISLGSTATINDSVIDIDTNTSIVSSTLYGILNVNKLEMNNSDIIIQSINSGAKCVNSRYSNNITLNSGHYYNKNNSNNKFINPFNDNVLVTGGSYAASGSTNVLYRKPSLGDPIYNYDNSKYQYIQRADSVTVNNVKYDFTHTVVPLNVCNLSYTQIGGGTFSQDYNTLQDAIDAIPSGVTENIQIKLLKNIDSLSGLTPSCTWAQFNNTKKITLDMAGHNINVSGTAFPIFIEEGEITLCNSTSSDVNLINQTGDAIHVGANQSTSTSVLHVDDPNHRIHVSAASGYNAIKVGWSYSSGGVDYYYYGDVTINGGCYKGDVVIGNGDGTGSTYSICGGYFTDGDLYTGYSYQKVTKGQHAHFIQEGYACIKTPTTDSHYENYKYMVVKDKDANLPSFLGSSCRMDELITTFYYVKNYKNVDATHDITDGQHKVVFTLSSADTTKAYPTRTIERTISAENYDSSTGAYKISFSETSPKQVGDFITAAVYKGDTMIVKHNNYSIKKYCNNTLVNSSYTSRLNLMGLLKCTLNYGTAAQNYFSYNIANPANDGKNTDFGQDDYTSAASIADDFVVDKTKYTEVTPTGGSLTIDGTTAINYYINIGSENVSNIKVFYCKGSSYDGSYDKELTLTKATNTDSNTIYQVTVPGIKSTYLARKYTVRFVYCPNGTVPTENVKYADITGSALSWARNIYNTETYLAKTMRAYYDYSKKYSDDPEN